MAKPIKSIGPTSNIASGSHFDDVVEEGRGWTFDRLKENAGRRTG